MRKTMNSRRWIGAMSLGVMGACVSLSAIAGEGGDLMLYDDNGKLTVGRYDFDGGTGVVLDVGPVTIVESELVADWEGGGTPGSDEPGIATDGSSLGDKNGIEFTFPANTSPSITALLLPVLNSNAAYWDGTGPVSFTSTLPNNIILEDPFGAELKLVGGAAAPVGSLVPWVSDSSGTAHDHIEFLLDASDATAAPGIYLFSLQYAAGSLIASDPVYYLLGWGGSTFDDETLEGLIEDAEAFVETNIVPEPASAAALLALGALVARRRR